MLGAVLSVPVDGATDDAVPPQAAKTIAEEQAEADATDQQQKGGAHDSERQRVKTGIGY